MKKEYNRPPVSQRSTGFFSTGYHPYYPTYLGVPYIPSKKARNDISLTRLLKLSLDSKFDREIDFDNSEIKYSILGAVIAATLTPEQESTFLKDSCLHTQISTEWRWSIGSRNVGLLELEEDKVAARNSLLKLAYQAGLFRLKETEEEALLASELGLTESKLITEEEDEIL